MYVKIISYYIVITKWLCNWWSRWPLLILRSKVKMLWNFLSISRTPYHISRYKVKGQASVNIGKYFLRLKYIEFLSNFVHCHIWRSRDMTRKIVCAKYLWDHLLFCLVPCEEVDSFQHCFLGEGWGVGGYVFLEYFLFFIVSLFIIFWFQKYH